jgi:signal peptidase I
VQVRRHARRLTSGLGARRNAAILIVVLAVVASVGVFARAFVLHPVTVSSSSMSPALCPGDRILVWSWRPTLADVRRGDVVVVKAPRSGTSLVKRAVGLPGDVVEIRDALLYVNDHLVEEPEVDHESIDSLYYGPVHVPLDHVLVLGDAREVSVDSRSFGPVPANHLLGTVVKRLATGSC